MSRDVNREIVEQLQNELVAKYREFVVRTSSRPSFFVLPLSVAQYLKACPQALQDYYTRPLSDPTTPSHHYGWFMGVPIYVTPYVEGIIAY